MTPVGFLLVAQAARQLGTSERHVRRLFDNGTLNGVRTESGYRLVDPDSLANYQVPHLRVAEAARMLGVSEDMVRRRFDAGELEGFRTARGHRRIDPACATRAAC
jgi:excisionase family DNA binding protein